MKALLNKIAKSRHVSYKSSCTLKRGGTHWNTTYTHHPGQIRDRLPSIETSKRFYANRGMVASSEGLRGGESKVTISRNLYTLWRRGVNVITHAFEVSDQIHEVIVARLRLFQRLRCFLQKHRLGHPGSWLGSSQTGACSKGRCHVQYNL